ncbi:Uncharacterised protein [uncultured archaeon]|nr:Uncharacterised protein [uncultured archaeon]
MKCVELKFAFIFLLLSASIFASFNSSLPLPPILNSLPSPSEFTQFFQNGSADGLARNLTQMYGNAPQQVAQGNATEQLPLEMPTLPVIQLRDIVIVLVVLSYVFAAGRIADFLQSSGRKIKKREAFAAPLAYMLAAAFGVIIYFSSGLWVPPQDTIITLGFYLLLVPLGIAVGLGALVLEAFFHDRLTSPQALDLSIRIIFSPLFDGLSGYWTALAAAGILILISGITSYSSGLNPENMPLDFLILSCIAAAYFLYRTLTARNNEARAGNAVTTLILITPGILRIYFKELVCAILVRLPFFSSCPLEQAGSDVTLALSVAATLVILIPLIPVAYALAVNLLRFGTLLDVLVKKQAPEKEDDESG